MGLSYVKNQAHPECTVFSAGYVKSGESLRERERKKNLTGRAGRRNVSRAGGGVLDAEAYHE